MSAKPGRSVVTNVTSLLQGQVLCQGAEPLPLHEGNVFRFDRSVVLCGQLSIITFERCIHLSRQMIYYSLVRSPVPEAFMASTSKASLEAKVVMRIVKTIELQKERYTAVQHLTQADPRRSMANCSSVNGQAAFRDEESDHRHIRYFQSLERLPNKLPTHLEEALNRDPRLCELEKEPNSVTRTILRRRSLEHYAATRSVRERRDRKILTRGRGVAQDKFKTDFVQNICLLLPERGRLAQKMAADQPLKPGET
ncbi:hypothetical protein V8E54_015077 [Elaphomyces granulatus]